MTVKRRIDPLVTLPPALRPAAWRWHHSLAVAVALIVGALVSLFPSDVAALAGQPVLDKTNALYMRAGLMGLALWVGLVIRGHPAWHTLICLLIAGFAGGQMLRALYTPDVTGVPLALMLANLACATYLIVQAVRPSVYERLALAQAELERFRKESR